MLGTVDRIVRYLNPIEHLGERRYSIVFPLIGTVLMSVVLEAYAYGIAHNPSGVGSWAIFISVGLIIYFSFREGIIGGLTATLVTIAYYFYLVYSLHYTGTQLRTGLITIFILAILYLFLTGVIGWLRQMIDRLIEREADERRRLETIIQQLPVGVLITDAQGRVTQSNRRVGEILGIKVPVGFVIGQEPQVRIRQSGREVNPARASLSLNLTPKKNISRRELELERGHKTAYLHISASAIRNRHGKVIAAASIIDDVTEQKELEKRKDDFVNMASHELKTPITSMKLYLDSLTMRLKNSSDERVVKTLNNIKLQTDRLQKLVNDLLDVSRLQTGKLAFDQTEFRLDKLIKETVDGISDASTGHQIIYKDKLRLKVYGDRFRLYQVLTNLITNAIKYSPEGSNIILRSFKQDGKAIVSVQDFGIGIPKDQQKRIFDRLYQVTEDTEKTFPGFGMGLFIAQQIVKRHKGNIWVESEKGKGSTFYISLPLKKV